MGWAGSPPWGDPTLEPTWLFGGANGGLWEGSCQGVHPRTSTASVLVLTVSQLPPASSGDPPTLAGRSGSVSYGVSAPSPWVLMHTLLCVCRPRVESPFPPALSKSCSQIPLAFKDWFSRNSSSHCQTPRLGSLTWSSQPSLHWVDFCGISVLRFVSHPPRGYGILFYCDCAPPTVSLWLLLCLWNGVTFWWVPVSSCQWLFRS